MSRQAADTPAPAVVQRQCAVCQGRGLSDVKKPWDEARKLSPQRKPLIGAADSPFEQEADRVAQDVLRAPFVGAASPRPPVIQRLGGTASAASAQAVPDSVSEVLGRSGSALPGSVRADMESRFQRDFSSVRVHTDSLAAQSAADIDAKAYTAGQHIVFGAGRFVPHSRVGRSLMAHELTHVVQQTGPGIVMRARSTFGAGGCASSTEEDENDSGPKGAGLRAHIQIQSFLLPTILNEVRIPRGTKVNIEQTGCQKDGTEQGRADLLKRSGVVNAIGEIKPVRHDPSQAVEEARHYVRRSDQSLDRLLGTGTCGKAGDDDKEFSRRLGLGKLRPTFNLLDGAFPAETVIGAFKGDSSRTLKAKQMAPGAIGYWCTGGKSDTYTCGSSKEDTKAYIDKVALGPAQDVLDKFIRDQIHDPLEKALNKRSLGELIKLAEKHVGARIREELKPYLGPLADQILNKASAQQLADLIDRFVGPEAVSIMTTLTRRIIDALVTEMRVQLRNVLADLIHEALLALCVGAPAVALVELLDKLKELLKARAKQLIPVVVAAVAAKLAVALAQELASMLASLMTKIGEAVGTALKFIGEVLIRALAVVAILILVAGAVIGAVLTLIAILDGIPGDEILVGAATAAVVALIPMLGRFVATGSMEEKDKGA